MTTSGLTLEFGCTPIVEPNRTAAYVANAQSPAYCLAGVNTLAPKPFTLSEMRVDCGCDALNFTTTAVGVAPTRTILGYTSPEQDIAPWYDPVFPESAYFYGFTIESVDDLHSYPGMRKVSDRVTQFGGGSIGTSRKKARVLKYTVLMFGNSDASMDYGFRWLSDVLSFQCDGDDCSLCDATIRTSCPTVGVESTYEDWDQGRWTLKDVALVDGPRVENGPIEGASCNVRRVSFTLASESPYAYKCAVPCLDDSTFVSTLSACPPSAWICGNPAAKVCCQVENLGIIGEEGLIITLAALSDMSDVTVSITPDPFGYVCGSVVAPVGYVAPEACATINIPSLPNGHTLVYDTSTQTIRVTYPGGVTRDGTSFIEVGDGVAPSFPTLRCGQFCVCVSVPRCSYNGSASTVTIATVHRELAI